MNIRIERLLARGRWLLELREFPLFLFTAFVILLALVIVFWLKSERAFRLVGLGLQLIGITAVAWNIRDTRKQFDRPGTFALAVQWLRRFPQFGASFQAVVADAVLATGNTLSAGADIWHNASPGADLEARVNALEGNLTRVRGKLTDFERETETKLAQRDKALAEEKQVRAEADKSVDEKLKALAVGGLHISTAGVVCLLAGVIMSTASMELSLLTAGTPLHVHLNDYAGSD